MIFIYLYIDFASLLKRFRNDISVYKYDILLLVVYLLTKILIRIINKTFFLIDSIKPFFKDIYPFIGFC